MLINLRNALMTGRRLPYDAELEFLESTGTQYIDTGVAPVDDATFVVCAAFTDLNTGRFGAVQLVGTGGTTYRYYFGVSNGKWIGAINSTNYNHNISQADTGIHIFKTNSLGLYIDDVMVVAAENSKPTIPVYLANIDGSSGAIPTKAKLYSCKIYDTDGTTLVRDFIPVRKGTVGYLYDRVSGKLFGNAGTGDFVLGPDVVPVEYIDFTGSQYLDFGFKPTQSTTVSMDIIPAVTGVNNIGWLSAGNGAGVKYECYGWSNRVQIYYGNEADTTWVAQVGDHIKIQLGKVSKFENLTLGTEKTKTFTDTSFTAAYNLTVGALNRGGYSYFAKMRLNSMSVSGDRTVNCVPIRVGTEGAMMDVLTRRIYRNAGTGKFGYGNDLKYPIPAE